MQLKRPFALALLVATGFCGGSGDAQPMARVDLRSSTYVDTDHTSVSTNAMDASGRASETVSLRARYLVDAVSSASVDVVASATRRFTMIRHEGTGAIGYDDGTRRVDGSYAYSHENDWTSHNASAGGSIDLRDHDLTLAASGSYAHNDVGRAHDPSFHRALTYAGGALRAIVVASPTALVSFAYEYHHYDGYQASPYRYVRFADPLAQLPVAAAESTPDRRNRHAFAFRANLAPDPRTFLRLLLRFYGDDWGVVSGTTSLEVERTFHRVALVGISRLYVQRGAGFYTDGVYPSRRAYMTMDRELSGFFDASLGATVRYRSRGERARVRLELRAIGTYYRFWEFYRLPDRLTWLLEVGLGVER